MPDLQNTSTFIDWVRTWDFLAIFYSVLAAFIFAILIGSRRIYTYLLRRFKNIIARRKYAKSLQDECENLIVVGKRQGLSMTQAFVNLDVVNSDLMTKSSDVGGKTSPSQSLHNITCVLIGGPGAGKSTLVKRRVLAEFRRRRGFPLPLFIRLRDYMGFDSIEDAIIHELSQAGFVSPELLLQDILQQSGLCVLDGLDEVKPDKRSKIIQDINVFYHKYYTKHGTMIVTCRREAYLDTPLDIPVILEVRPLRDEQIQLFAKKWSPGYPRDKSAVTFWRDLTATPRIHELARSPLLLVGGLMQYTESNAGVPDERYKYLERVAQWLISDWATAQGHPPDTFRSLYDRVLPKLAFEMHKRNTAEIPIGEAEILLQQWLPTYGVSDKKASEVIANLRTRTGIVVADDQHHLIFGQFGLQEYFASLEINLLIGPENMEQLKPLSWWREPILLAIAQQRDPNDYLDALFLLDPVLAAAAVAECPTPSLDQQNNAITRCIHEVDSTNDAVKTPIIQLLRKLEGEAEAALVRQLEERLTNSSKLAKFVGLIFATAGTSIANETLSRHPEVWATCLTDAGYLSDSFETLLFSWVEQGNDKQCFSATDALFENLHERNIVRLLELLPKLTSNKADYLAKRILTMMLQSPNKAESTAFPFIASLAVRCVPYLKKPEKFLKSQLTERQPRDVEIDFLSVRDFPQSPISYIAALVFLCKMDEKQDKEHIVVCIQKWLSRSREWSSKYSVIFCAYAASLSILATLSNVIWVRLQYATVCFILLVVAVTKTTPRHAFNRGKRFQKSFNAPTAILFGACCFSLVFLTIDPIINVVASPILAKSTPILIFLFGVNLIGYFGNILLHPQDIHEYLAYRKNSFHFGNNFQHMNFQDFMMPLHMPSSLGSRRLIIPNKYLLFCLCLLLWVRFSSHLVDNITAVNASAIVSFLILITFLLLNIIVIQAHLVVCRASKSAENFLKSKLKNLDLNP